MSDENIVELGFLEKCDSWQAESYQFPSKVGGKPAWLCLENLPTQEQLQCKKCKQTMIFLCQLYAPYNDKEESQSSNNDCDNFHRTLFVFICRKAKCCEINNSDNVKVFRSSLSRNNKFYSCDPPENNPNSDFSLSKWLNLCNLCGCQSEKKCSKCKKVYYCNKEHQVIDWKESHKMECSSINMIKKYSQILFSEWEIVIESEYLEATESSKEEDELKKFKQMKLENKIGTMSKLSDEEFAANILIEEDKVFSKFQKRIKYYPEQVIRYKRGGQPLWIAAEPVLATIPACQYCSGPRRFEFQIMPQLLSLLKEGDIDWGTLVVYTCKQSCKSNISYKEEFVFKQDIK